MSMPGPSGVWKAGLTGSVRTWLAGLRFPLASRRSSIRAICLLVALHALTLATLGKQAPGAASVESAPDRARMRVPGRGNGRIVALRQSRPALLAPCQLVRGFMD